MNTKTMRLPPRRVLTSDKRVIPGAAAGKPPETAVINPPPPPPPVKSILKKNPPRPTPATVVSGVIGEPAGSNQLLAGYLAHEFLNKGTILGEEWNPTRSQPGPFTAQITEARKTNPNQNLEWSHDHKRRRYVEVAHILRVDGVHLPGIVNPTQLARSFKL